MTEYDDQNNNITNKDNKLVSFSFENNSIRVIDNNGEPWFVAKDVALALGYVKTRNAISQHCKDAKSLQELKEPWIKALQQNQGLIDLHPQTKLIRTPDVFALVFGSDLPSAQDFKWWVYEDVLPSIKETGSYSLESNGELKNIIKEQNELISLLNKQVEKMENKFENEILKLQKDIENISKYDIPDRNFTLSEIVKYINEKCETNGRKTSNHTFWKYLKTNIKMIKSNDEPYVDEIKNEFIINSKNIPFLNEDDYGVLFTQLGFIKILRYMKNKRHIK